MSAQGDMDRIDRILFKARATQVKASAKFPQPNFVLLKVAEEAGEVVRAGVHYAEGRLSWGELEDEVVQTIAMLLRLIVEGDQINGIIPPHLKLAPGEPPGRNLNGGNVIADCRADPVAVNNGESHLLSIGHAPPGAVNNGENHLLSIGHALPGAGTEGDKNVADPADRIDDWRNPDKKFGGIR